MQNLHTHEKTIARKNRVGFLVPEDLNNHVLTTHVVISMDEKKMH
jgi:hypothetical protein